MKSKIKFLRLVFTTAVVFFLGAGFTPAPLDIEIDVAPNVLNLANQGEVVTIHTDIPYSWIATDIFDKDNNVKVFLNGIAIDWWKSDNQGNFVAKFYIEAVKGLVDEFELPVELDLTLVWNSTLYGTCTGTQPIKFIDVSAVGKK